MINSELHKLVLENNMRISELIGVMTDTAKVLELIRSYYPNFDREIDLEEVATICTILADYLNLKADQICCTKMEPDPKSYDA